jgi:glycosyltransferase involved in cell wall biosynthesis
MKITIVIDAPNYIGGIRYIERFLKILSFTKKHVEITLIYVNCNKSIDFSMPCKEIFLNIPSSLYRIDRLVARFTGFSIFSLSLIKYIKNNNVFFSDVFLPGYVKRKNNIKLIHWFPDFQVYDLEHLFSATSRLSRKLYIKLQLKTCDYLLTQSVTDQTRMKQSFPEYADKIVKWSFAEPYVEIPEIEKLEIKGVTIHRKEYLLYPHQGWAHKNHLLLINILKNFENETLILTGRLSDPRNEAYTAELANAIKSSKNRIINLGLISGDELELLMKNAKAILNLSSYEGWASCVEEGAMMGVPLILSNIPIHKEQLEDALFVDISSEASAIKTLTENFDLLSSYKKIDHEGRIKKSVDTLNIILEKLE